MAKPKRTASLKTMRQNISHLRKMISRLDQLPLTVPEENYKPVKVRRMGSRLIVDGVVYKPADLEKMIANKQKVEWHSPVLQQLEKMLGDEEYRRDAVTGKRNKITALTKLEQEQAIRGVARITSEEEEKFNTWLNSGSDGWKKNLYYHVYGARSINNGDIRGFMELHNVDTIEDLEETLSK